jgi:DNA-binding NtrC family response regulator
MSFALSGEPTEVDELTEEIGDLRRALARAGGPLAGLVGKSPEMQEIFRAIFASAERRAPVIVAGESGSGRSTVAAAIHHLSARGRSPVRSFIASPSLPIEDAGSVVEAATGAGLLLLKGIAHVSLAAQERILRFAEEPGAPRLAIVSPPDGGAAVAEGRLLSAIFETAEILPVSPLRERREDIPLLSEYFLRPGDAPAPVLDPKALEAMAAHEWAGNVRELRNVIRRARALSDGPVIGLTAIQSVLGGDSVRIERAGGTSADKEIVPVRVGDSMADIERRVLQRTLRFAKGNKKKAAEILELSLKTIYNKVKEYGLEREFNRRFRKARRSE